MGITQLTKKTKDVSAPAVAYCGPGHSQQPHCWGSNADIADYPWQGSYRTAAGSHTCGTVLVADTWALCAAHCGGSSSYSTEFGNTYPGITAVTLHPNYGSGSGAFPNDISVVQLSGNAPCTPIAMSDTRIDSGDGQISGWGRTCGGCALPITLQAVDIPVITDAECTAIWGNNYNGDVHVCVYDSVNQDRGGCNGDSGGPMVANGVLQGITSWGASGCLTTYASSYTRVSTFQDWACGEMGGAGLGC